MYMYLLIYTTYTVLIQYTSSAERKQRWANFAYTSSNSYPFLIRTSTQIYFCGKGFYWSIIRPRAYKPHILSQFGLRVNSVVCILTVCKCRVSNRYSTHVVDKVNYAVVLSIWLWGHGYFCIYCLCLQSFVHFSNVAKRSAIPYLPFRVAMWSRVAKSSGLYVRVCQRFCSYLLSIERQT